MLRLSTVLSLRFIANLRRAVIDPTGPVTDTERSQESSLHFTVASRNDITAFGVIVDFDGDGAVDIEVKRQDIKGLGESVDEPVTAESG